MCSMIPCARAQPVQVALRPVSSKGPPELSCLLRLNEVDFPFFQRRHFTLAVLTPPSELMALMS